MKRVTRARLLRAALRCYPRTFLQRFGRQLEADLELEVDGASPAELIRLLAGLVVDGCGERLTAMHHAPAPRTGPRRATPDEREGTPMFFDSLRSDFRQTFRLAASAPLTTAATLLVLALGIGGSSAMFAVIDSVLLRPLPYRNASELVMVWSADRNEGREQNTISPANFVDYREQNQTLSALEYTLSFLIPLAMQGADERGLAQALRTGPELFRVLGREAALGRTYTSGDRNVVVLSHSYWARVFGQDATVVGRTLTFSGGESLQVVGVMPPDFVFPYRTMFGDADSGRAQTADVWIPMPFEGARFVDAGGALVRSGHALTAFGRLRPGVTIEEARADLAMVAARLEQAYPASNRGWGASVVPLSEQTVSTIRPALLLLMSGVGVLLLMAAINVANLILARNVSRQREFAMRVALGASRIRLAQQALAETLLLSIAGAICGWLVTRSGISAFVALAPPALPRLQEVVPSLTVFAFSTGLAVAIGVLVGVLPALFVARTDPRQVLQEDARGTIGSAARRRARRGLVACQMALAVVVTIGTALLVRSFATLLDVDPGFRPERVLTLQINAPDRLTSAEARLAFYEQMFDALAAIPGVAAVGGTTRIPLGSSTVTTSVEVEGRPSDGTPRPQVEFRRSMRDYFETLGIPVLRGRGLRPGDGLDGSQVAVVNEALARRLFGGEEAVGQRIRTGPASTGPWTEIVGVIGNIRHTSLEAEPLPELYVNYASNPPVGPFIAVRATGDASRLSDDVRRVLRSLEPSLAIYDMQTMDARRAESIGQRRFVLLLVGAFGALSLLLAAVGVYGVMSLMVAERTAEMGVRLALGATSGQVLRLVVREALLLAATGMTVGLVIASALAPLLANQLFGIATYDPASFVAASLILLSVAALATLAPARRAMQLDPVEAMRA